MADKFYYQYPEEDAFLTYSACAQLSMSSDVNLGNFPITDPQRASLGYIGNQSYNLSTSYTNCALTKYTSQNVSNYANPPGTGLGTSNQQQFGQNYGSCSSNNRNRYAPYHNRTQFGAAHAAAAANQQLTPFLGNCNSVAIAQENTELAAINSSSSNASLHNTTDSSQAVTLQINNLDYSLDENSLRHFLVNQLKPITPVLSLVFEGSLYAKVTVPHLFFAKQVVANLHRKKIGHKRMIVSYTRDSSQTEINTLRCQVAGLLKDVPYCTLPMYKFRELFQSRFKTSISVLDLYKMQDICHLTTDENKEKYISLRSDLINSIENTPLMECLQLSVPYCTIHFKREQHKGWAEQDIEPLPSVSMTISEIQQIIYPLLKRHPGDIPVASLVHCIAGELGNQIVRNENGVNLEHLICCVHGIQITTNNFGIKILGWLKTESISGKEANDGRYSFSKNGLVADPLYQISREVVELIKMSPKSTMKFNRFIPAYHNHFGKQCRVADYGYTKLIELFEALSSVVQIMGDGENRQITLTHRTQIRRFTSDLLRVLRSQGSKSILLSQLSKIFSQAQNKNFDITDYGVCEVVDILDGLVNSNIVVVTTVQNGKDILISIPQRKQTPAEVEKTSTFAGEVVELFRNAPQYSIQFQKFVRSYHYHFGYQCRLSDYGFTKLADLMESIQGVVEIEFNNDEDKRIYLTPLVARRVFTEQLDELITECSCTKRSIMLDEALKFHKKKFGYQIQPQTLGCETILDAIKNLPYIELLKVDDIFWIICHANDRNFRRRCFQACRVIRDFKKDTVAMEEFLTAYEEKYNETLTEQSIIVMRHAIEIKLENQVKYVRLTRVINFLIAIVRILDQGLMTLAELKSTMNINLGDCFEFGYPNVYNLLRAYPDVFTIEPGPTQEKSVIGLVAHSEFSNLSKSYYHMQQNHSDKPEKKLPLSHHQDYQALPAPSKNAYFLQSAQCNNSTVQCSQNAMSKAKSTCPDMCNANSENHFAYNKENCQNVTNNACNGSLNSSSMSDMNISSCSTSSLSGYASSGKLWDRRRSQNVSGDCNILDFLSGAPTCSYEPPKPDTPPSEVMPFWIDPIWANSNGEKSPKIDSLNIKLPEMKSFNILPMLMSPYSLSKFENTKKMFSFDSIDKNIW